MKIYNVSEPIVNSYITLIKAGKRTIKDVPEKFQEEIAAILDIPLKELTLEEEKELKIEELSKMCEQNICDGIDVVLPSDNKTYHYSFTLTDQNNIKTCFDLAVSTKSATPYHADGEGCRLYSPIDIVTIYAEEQYYITKQTTFFNYLKQQIKSLNAVDEVRKITYKSELTGDFKTGYESILAYAEVAKDSIKQSYISE